MSEAAVRMCSLKLLFWKFQENFQETTRGGMLLIAKNKIMLLEISKNFQNSYSNMSGCLLLWIVKCPKELLFFSGHFSALFDFRIFNTLKRLTFFHPLINSILKHPLINLVIRSKDVKELSSLNILAKSNATCY